MERCPKCDSSDLILAELDWRGCKECGHWWEYNVNADARSAAIEALSASWQRLDRLLTYAPDFPAAERDEWAATKELVTEALEKLGVDPSFQATPNS